MPSTPARVPSTPELEEQRVARDLAMSDLQLNSAANVGDTQINRVVEARPSSDQLSDIRLASETSPLSNPEVSSVTCQLIENRPTTPLNASIDSEDPPTTPGKGIHTLVTGSDESTHVVTPTEVDNESVDSQYEINIRCPSRLSATQQHLDRPTVLPMPPSVERIVKRTVERICNSDEPVAKRKRANHSPSVHSNSTPTSTHPLRQSTYLLRHAENHLASASGVDVFWKELFVTDSFMNGWLDGKTHDNFERIEREMKSSIKHNALWGPYLERSSFESKCPKPKDVRISYNNTNKKKALARIVDSFSSAVTEPTHNHALRGRELADVHIDNECAICKAYGFSFRYMFGQRIVHPCPLLGALKEGDVAYEKQHEVVRMRKSYTGKLRMVVNPVHEFDVEFDMFNNVCYEDTDIFSKALKCKDHKTFHDNLAYWICKFESAAAELRVGNGPFKAFKCNPLTRFALLLPPSDILKIVKSNKYQPPATLVTHIDHLKNMPWSRTVSRKTYYSDTPRNARTLRVVFMDEEYYPGFPVVMELSHLNFWLIGYFDALEITQEMMVHTKRMSNNIRVMYHFATSAPGPKCIPCRSVTAACVKGCETVKDDIIEATFLGDRVQLVLKAFHMFCLHPPRMTVNNNAAMFYLIDIVLQPMLYKYPIPTVYYAAAKKVFQTKFCDENQASYLPCVNLKLFCTFEMLVRELANLHDLMSFSFNTKEFCKARNGIITHFRALAKQPEIRERVEPLGTFEMLQTSLLLVQKAAFEEGEKRKALFDKNNEERLSKQQDVYEGEVEVIVERVNQINSDDPEWLAAPTFTPSRL